MEIAAQRVCYRFRREEIDSSKTEHWSPLHAFPYNRPTVGLRVWELTDTIIVTTKGRDVNLSKEIILLVKITDSLKLYQIRDY